jgi:hypothetical protein
MDCMCYKWRFPPSLVSTSVLKHNSMQFLLVGAHEGHDLCTPFAPLARGSPEQNQLFCGDHHIWNAAVGVAGIRLSHWCVPGNEMCTYRGTLMPAYKIWIVKLPIDMLWLYVVRNTLKLPIDMLWLYVVRNTKYITN